MSSQTRSVNTNDYLDEPLARYPHYSTEQDHFYAQKHTTEDQYQYNDNLGTAASHNQEHIEPTLSKTKENRSNFPSLWQQHHWPDSWT